jgi:hypothetical protein
MSLAINLIRIFVPFYALMIMFAWMAGYADRRFNLEFAFSLSAFLCCAYVFMLEAESGTMPKKIEAKILEKFPKLKNANEIMRIALAITLMLITVSMFLICSLNFINTCFRYIANLIGMP